MLKILRQPGSLFRGRSAFFQNTLKLFIGSGIAQAISVLLSPILTRLFDPNDFGLYTFYIYIVAGLVLIASLRYELAIVYSDNDRDAVNVLSLSTIISLALSFLVLILVILYRLFLYHLLPVSPILLSWFFWMPALIICLSVTNILQNWLVRKKEFRTLSAGKVVNSIGNNGFMLLLGVLGWGAWGLFTGYFAGTVIFLLFLLFMVFRSNRGLLRMTDRQTLRLMTVKYKDLPLSNSPQALFEMLQNYGIIYLAKIFFSSTIVGFYALSMRILQAPLWLIGSAFFQVYMQDASDRYNRNESLVPLVNKTMKMAFLAVTPVLITLFIFGPWLFGVVFGHNWREAGVYARILAPWMFFDFVRFTVSQTPMIVGKARTMFHISLIGNALMIAAMCIGGWMHQVITGFVILSCLMSLYAISVILWIRYIAAHVKKGPAPDNKQP
ncbi:MAG TPA: oligosaccharide flippase family protein [Bacteroidales bacterium]|nr:oligosaccharide flippase family protein [Bacteroidales bacterium]